MSSEDRAWEDYTDAFRREVLPKIMSSAVTLQIYSGDGSDFDVQQATELGALLLLDKPLIVVVTPGAAVPRRLARAADIVIEDWSPDNTDAQERIAAFIRTIPEEA